MIALELDYEKLANELLKKDLPLQFIITSLGIEISFAELDKCVYILAMLGYQSRRIEITDNSIDVRYYEPEDINVPWWKFWLDKCSIVNRLNSSLHYEFNIIRKIHHLPPKIPPLKYSYGILL